MAHISDLAARRGTTDFGNRFPRGCPSQFFRGAALYQQWNEIAQGALGEPCIHLLDYRHNAIVRHFCILLGKTTLYRIDLCPLFLRHARHHRTRTGVWSSSALEAKREV
ncbi:MAG: hypothetical protein JO106_16225 [Mycobacterium sp.]|nr:hypothetical protein [Mycobacterium sp.]